MLARLLLSFVGASRVSLLASVRLCCTGGPHHKNGAPWPRVQIAAARQFRFVSKPYPLWNTAQGFPGAPRNEPGLRMFEILLRRGPHRHAAAHAFQQRVRRVDVIPFAGA